MEKYFKHNGSSAPPQIEPDVVALIKKIQQHLVFLEKKIDTLISRSSEKPSKGQHFSKPFRSYGHSQHHGKRNTIVIPEKEDLIRNVILIENRAAETEGLIKERNHFSTCEKIALKFP